MTNLDILAMIGTALESSDSVSKVSYDGDNYSGELIITDKDGKEWVIRSQSIEELNDQQVPAIYELDENGEATGTVHLFCSNECRAKSRLPIGPRYCIGLSPVTAYFLSCETCEKSLG